MKLAVFPCTSEGQRVVAACRAVGWAHPLGDAPVVHIVQPVHVVHLADAHHADVATFSAFAGGGHEFRAGVDHELVRLSPAPGVDVDRAFRGVQDAMEALLAEVNPPEDEGVALGLDEVAGNAGVPRGQVGVKHVGPDNAEGVRAPAGAPVVSGHGQGQSGRAVLQSGAGSRRVVPLFRRSGQNVHQRVVVIGHSAGGGHGFPVLRSGGGAGPPLGVLNVWQGAVPLGLGAIRDQKSEQEKQGEMRTGHVHATI